MCWPQHADHRPTPNGFAATLARRGIHWRGRPHAAAEERQPDEECALRGGEYVRHLVRIARELAELPASRLACMS